MLFWEKKEKKQDIKRAKKIRFFNQQELILWWLTTKKRLFIMTEVTSVASKYNIVILISYRLFIGHCCFSKKTEIKHFSKPMPDSSLQ